MAKSQELLKQNLQLRMSNYGYYMVEKQVDYEGTAIIAYLILPNKLASKAEEISESLLPTLTEEEKPTLGTEVENTETEPVTSFDQTDILTETQFADSVETSVNPDESKLEKEAEDKNEEAKTKKESEKKAKPAKKK